MDGIRVFSIQGVLAVGGIGPQSFGVESCDAAIGWTVDFNEQTITQMRSYAHVAGDARLVVAGSVEMVYREGTSSCHGGTILQGTEASVLDPGNGEGGPLGLAVQASAAGGPWTIAGRKLQAGAVASAIVDQPGRHGLVHVTDLGVWNRSAMRFVDGFQDLPGQGMRPILGDPGRATLVHDVWPDGSPNGTYRHLRVTGTLQESGPDYRAQEGCGIAPATYREDLRTKEAWLARRALLPWDGAGWNAVPLRATMLAVDNVGVAPLHDRCTGEFPPQVASGTVLDMRIWREGSGLRIELTPEGLSVNGRALPPGGTLTVPVSFTRTVDYGAGPATYAYSGDVSVADEGAWPRAGLHSELYGWVGSPAQHA